jgi:hypothetical protein
MKDMKEFKLSAWPELPGPYDRTPYRRLLNDISHRYAGVHRLAECSGLGRHEVRQFLELLETRGVLLERDRAAPDSVFDSLRPISGWLRRTFSETPQRS